MQRLLILLAVALGAPALAIQPQGTIADVWQPAATPKGGVSWKLLESTRETTRQDENGYIRAKPVFPPEVKALNGKRVKVAGFMMPLQNAAKQTHFVLLAYPPGCPFHLHAGPAQFVEVKAEVAFPVDLEGVTVVEGVMELTGEDEGGVFYRMTRSRPG